ncbi:hypothetical protein NEF87_001195 [Candidatus Lokiarchaeum ossiferum]|uniref:DUF4013 domain-containing protein n=1 Tax=Candidatus Lokiarchaeum ossiferum TaxID=2951803 RepID=A0ABY6HN18_9ARCH|nr:hypothetical protein NEF87_001195 [Candidatus Lokiarchaeum sp. B-35]
MQWWIIGLALIMVLGMCPLIGRLIYKMNNKVAFLFYLILSLILSAIIFIITEHPSWDSMVELWGDYFGSIIQLKIVYIFSFLTYITAGVGIIGGVLEYVGEHAESADAYKKYDKKSPIKLYIYFIIYGYIFLFAIFAFSQFLFVFFQWEFPGTLLNEFFRAMLFHNIILALIGNILTAIKIFRFGFFSVEFYRSEFHPSVADIGPKLRGFRKFSACIVGSMGVYICCFILVMELFPNTAGETVTFGRSIYFLAATIQSILFYLLKDRYVDQLKPLSKQYDLKVGTGSYNPSEKEEALKESDEDLKFID